jgi:hypothetical protein
MKLFGRELSGFAKALTILVAILLVSSGLCGLEFFASDKRGPAVDVLVIIGAVAGIAVACSAFGIVVTLGLWLAAALRARFGRPPADRE